MMGRLATWRVFFFTSQPFRKVGNISRFGDGHSDFANAAQPGTRRISLRYRAEYATSIIVMTSILFISYSRDYGLLRPMRSFALSRDSLHNTTATL